MSKNIFTYIHNNHTTPILYKIDVPESTEIKRIESLKNYTYISTDFLLVFFHLIFAKDSIKILKLNTFLEKNQNLL